MRTVAELQEKSAELRKFFDQHLPYARPTPVLADFVRIQHELMWGGVWLVDGLDLKLRSFATITAQCVNGYDFGVEHQVRTGLTIGITPRQIKGIFVQLLFYAGVPATVSGLRIAQDVINEREEWKSDDVPLNVDWLNSIEDMLNQGKSLRIKHWGELADQEIEGSLAQQMVPEAADLVDGYHFGQVWTLTKVVTGLTIGITPRQIKGIFVQLLFYAGVPATVSGLRIAQDVINEREEWKSDDVPLNVDWLNSIEDMLNQGKSLRIKHWGELADQEIEGSLAQQMVPEAADLVDGYHFGQVWALTDLSPKERMVCILAALMCRGHLKQLKRHVGYALEAGLNRKEVCEVFAQAGWYRGWPCVEDALVEANQVFKERGW